MELSRLQTTMRVTYLERDAARGGDATFRWLTEEVGELAKAMRTGDRENLEHEFGDVFAWLMSLANVEGVMNAVICRAEPVGQVVIMGPGAGPELAGQGVLSDLIALAGRLA